MSRLSALEREQTNLTERLKQSIVSGDYDTMRACQRSQVELSDRLFFAKTEQLKADISELEESRKVCFDLQNDFAEELQRQAQTVTDARSALYDAEKGYANITSRQYALGVEIESRRTAIKEAKAKLDTHINTRLNEVTV